MGDGLDVQEEESSKGSDGVLGYTCLFKCAPRKGYFTGLCDVRRDSRFTESSLFIHRNPDLSQHSTFCVVAQFPSFLCIVDRVAALLPSHTTVWGKRQTLIMVSSSQSDTFPEKFSDKLLTSNSGKRT